jgi:hypothetical protein
MKKKKEKIRKHLATRVREKKEFYAARCNKRRRRRRRRRNEIKHSKETKKTVWW